MAKGRKTGGRKAGTPNRATAEIKALAQQHTTESIQILMGIARDQQRKHPQAAVSAIQTLLAYGHGKPAQAVTGEGGGPIRLEVAWQS